MSRIIIIVLNACRALRARRVGWPRGFSFTWCHDSPCWTFNTRIVICAASRVVGRAEKCQSSAVASEGDRNPLLCIEKRNGEAALPRLGQAAMLCSMRLYLPNPVRLPLPTKCYRCKHETFH